MSTRPSIFTTNILGFTQQEPEQDGNSASSPAEQRDDAKRNFLKTMRPLPTQHYWNVWFDPQNAPVSDSSATSQPANSNGPSISYSPQLEQLGTQIESIQDFWRYANNTPVEKMKLRESIYLFKSGFRPVWEDRRNINGGSWTFRVPKGNGPDVWTQVQLLAIGEVLQGDLEEGDQICGVGLSVRFNAHLITVWHRDSSKQKSIDSIAATVLANLSPELRPKADSYFYKKHADHMGFKAPPKAQAVPDSQKTEGQQ